MLSFFEWLPFSSILIVCNMNIELILILKSVLAQTSSSLTATSIFPFYCVYQLYAQWGDWRTLQTLSWFNNISFLTIDFNNSIAIHCSIGVWMLMWPVGSLTCEPTIWNHFNHDNVSIDIILVIWPFHQLCIVSTSYSFKFVFCVTLDW